MLDSSRFSQLREELGIEKAPSLIRFMEARVLAFDQSLSNTGWVLMKTGDHRVEIEDKGVIKISTDLSSHESTYEKAHLLGMALTDLMRGIDSSSGGSDLDVIMERPPVGGYRIESILLAGREVDRVSRMVLGIIPTMIANNAMKSILNIKDKKSKSGVKYALLPYISDIENRSWNEHMRDAAALGLVSQRRLET